MTRRTALVAAAVAASIPAAASAALLGRGPAWTPLDLSSGAIFATGNINGHPVEMAIDSGASTTVLDVELARRLGIAVNAGGSVLGMSGAARPAMRAGGFLLSLADVQIDFPENAALVLDLSAFAVGGRSVQFLVGRELFESARLDLDFPKGRLASSVKSAPSGAVRLPLSHEPQDLRAVPVSIDGRPNISATFDLGAGLPFQVSRDWAQANGLLAGRRLSNWFLTGVEGVSPYITLTLPRLSLAGFELSDVPIGVVDNQPQGSSPALIGLPIWRRFRLLADFSAESLWLTPDRAWLKAPFSRDRSGLGVRTEGDGLQVVLVATNSPAEAAGWKVGERIVTVNGRRIGPDWPGSKGSAWARGRPGTKISLTLADGAQRALVLADYY